MLTTKKTQIQESYIQQLLDQFRTMENSQLVDKISELNIHLWGDEEPFKGGTVLFGQKP